MQKYQLDRCETLGSGGSSLLSQPLPRFKYEALRTEVTVRVSWTGMAALYFVLLFFFFSREGSFMLILWAPLPLFMMNQLPCFEATIQSYEFVL